MTWRTVELADKKGQVDLGRTFSHDDDLAAYGYAEVESPSDRTAQMAVGSDDTLTVWLNGKEVYRVRRPPRLRARAGAVRRRRCARGSIGC